jgi:hypothetical protein
MSDMANPDIKVLLFYAVVFDPEEFTPSKHVKSKNSEIKSYAERTRLLKWRQKGKALYLSANDATWRWVGEHLGDELPRTKTAFLILNTLRGRLAHYLAAKGLPLSEVFAPKPESREETVPSLPPAEQVRRAYLELSQGQFDVRVRLRDLRPRLPGLSRTQQDETLQGMQRDGWLVLYPNDDPQDRNLEDNEAALIIGDRHRDVVYLHREQRQ